MLHNKRREPPDLPKPIPKWFPPSRDDVPLAKRRQRGRQLNPWRYDMTLCLAAISIGSRTPPRDVQFALVTVTDERIETDVAGGNFGTKKKLVTHEHEWQALWAGGEAEADDLANTLIRLSLFGQRKKPIARLHGHPISGPTMPNRAIS